MSYCETITEPISLKKLLVRINKAKNNGDTCIIMDPETLCPRKDIGNHLESLGYLILGEPTSPDSWRVKIHFYPDKYKMSYLNEELISLARLSNNFDEKIVLMKRLIEKVETWGEKKKKRKK